MKVFAGVAAIAAACVLTSCTNTVDGVVAQTTEPVSAQGMTCADFNALGERDRMTVIEEVLDGGSTERPVFLVGLAKVICDMVPDADLEEILTGLG
ncbi:hypothetical protein BH10ACT9_BH10ACT9_28580 [soil metagenome]